MDCLHETLEVWTSSPDVGPASRSRELQGASTLRVRVLLVLSLGW